jgi:hypothetical protein
MVDRAALRTTAERHFPVRVRVAVPPGGFGNELARMYEWLDDHVGKDRYWSGGAGDHSDAACFYFLTVDNARAFVERFGCRLPVEGDWQATRDYWGRFSRRNG